MGRHIVNNIEAAQEMEEHNLMKSVRGGIGQKQRLNKNEKGFTLVELIVVIVILAILAAILIPGLLKWIDEARLKKYELEARSIYQAAEAESIKLYGKKSREKATVMFGEDSSGTSYNSEELDSIKKKAGIDKIEFVQITYKYEAEGDYATYRNMVSTYVVYTSSDGKRLTAMWGLDDLADMPGVIGTKGGWLFMINE